MIYLKVDSVVKGGACTDDKECLVSESTSCVSSACK